MITIVCSTQYKNDEYQKYLKDTCGVKNAEVIMIENDGKYSLAESYNMGLSQAKYDIVVFVHDDLEFDTRNWGRLVNMNFQSNPDIGIFGLAGTPKIGSDGCWWTDRSQMKGIVNHSDGSRKWESRYSAESGAKPIPVVLIDGLFMAIHRDRIVNNFDESFTGFHYYDIPFCVSNYLDGVDIAVFTNIRVTHLSVGQTNQEWENNRQLFITKYGSDLPLEIDE